MVTHADSRRFGGDDNYEYSPLRIIVAKQNGDGYERVTGIAAAFQRDTWVVFMLHLETIWFMLKCAGLLKKLTSMDSVFILRPL